MSAISRRRTGGLVAVSLLAFGLAQVLPQHDAAATPIPGGTITVTAFRDYNANGTLDTTGTGEPGLGAVKVQATCVTDSGSDGIVGTIDDVHGTATGVTTASGTLTLSVPGSPCRLEAAPDASMASVLSALIKPGAAGATTVQFAAVGATASFGFNVPSDYCQANPKLAMACFTYGDNLGGTFSTNQNLHVFNEDATSINMGPDGRATAAQIGSTWGVAYQRSSKTIFASAYLKGHTGYGPNGPYAIYRASPTTAGSGALFVDLNSAALGGPYSADQHGTVKRFIASLRRH